MTHIPHINYDVSFRAENRDFHVFLRTAEPHCDEELVRLAAAYGGTGRTEDWLRKNLVRSRTFYGHDPDYWLVEHATVRLPTPLGDIFVRQSRPVPVLLVLDGKPYEMHASECVVDADHGGDVLRRHMADAVISASDGTITKPSWDDLEALSSEDLAPFGITMRPSDCHLVLSVQDTATALEAN